MLRSSRIFNGTLVKMGRGLLNVTEEASNSLLESLQNHGYCYVQHPFIQKQILEQLHRDCRIFFEQYILQNAPTHSRGSSGSLVGMENAHHYNCTPLSQFELESIRAPHGFRGYYRYVGASGMDDAIDCFSVGREDVPDPSVLRRAYFEGSGWEESEFLPVISRRNPWDVLLNHVNSQARGPNNNDNFMSDFRDMMVAYYEMCYMVSIDVLRHISCGLGIRPSIPQGGQDPSASYDLDYFTAFHSKRDCDMQAKYYPRIGDVMAVNNGVELQNSQSAQNPGGVRVLRRKGAKAKPFTKGEQSVVRLDSHKDLSTVTLLSQDALGGLEVWDASKQAFTEVPVLEDALLVNAGLFLEKWTGGLIEATPHRVRSNVKADNRCSIVFFGLPDHDARIEPLLQQGDNPALDGEESFLAGDMMPVH